MKTLENRDLGASLRVIEKDGEPWFVANDVCRVIGIANSRDAVLKLDDDERGVASADTRGGAQKMTIVSESGLYALILRSDKPAARAFRKWVTAEVLPEIRRSGGYGSGWEAELARLEREHAAAEAAFDAAAVALADFQKRIVRRVLSAGDCERSDLLDPAGYSGGRHRVPYAEIAAAMPCPMSILGSVDWMAGNCGVNHTAARSRIYRMLKSGILRRRPDGLLATENTKSENRTNEIEK